MELSEILGADALVSVVIPAHNEECSIESVVREAAAEVASVGPFEMIVVDDASSDNTLNILGRLQLEHPWLTVERLDANVGHGAAVAVGMRRARAPWVFQLDADSQFVVADFGRLWARRNDGDLIIGVRTPRRDAMGRIVLSRCVSRFTSVFAGRRLQDVNSPFRLFRRSLWDVVPDVIGPAPLIPSVLTCVVAARLGVPIVEVPVQHLARPFGRSTLSLRRLVPLLTRGAMEVVRTSRATRSVSFVAVRERVF